jgi:microcystin degradation protein MlrC
VPRILIAECKQEVSTFNPVLSRYADFNVSFGQQLIDYHRTVRNEVGGALSVFDQQPKVELIPTYSAKAITSAGTLAADDFQRIASELLESLKTAPPVEGVYFAMHGAMGAEGEDDPEGYLLQEARKILGEQVPLVVSLDLHGILTDRMLKHADAVVAYHTYPHVDFFETGERAAKLLLRIMAGEVKPVTARVKIPALVRGDELITATGLFGESIRAAQAMEARPGGLSAGMFIGNPFTDVLDLRTNAFVVTDGDEARACREAEQMAAGFWKHREKMQVPLTGLPDAIRLAKEAWQQRLGTCILVDAADATSSGASGDSNAILRELAAQDYQGRALCRLWIPRRCRTLLPRELERKFARPSAARSIPNDLSRISSKPRSGSCPTDASAASRTARNGIPAIPPFSKPTTSCSWSLAGQ